MFRAIFLQVVVTIIAAIVAGLIVGSRGAFSAVAGGAACAFPNLLFALRLRSISFRHKKAFPLNFFLGEFVKVVLTILLLLVAVKGYADLHWPSMLIGLGLALQAGFLAFLKKS
jgi:ATP synthase protein I